jgi:hypothetical protein
MPVSVEKLPDEPIIVATVVGHFDVKMARELFQKSAEMAQGIDGHYYRVTDARQMDIGFGEMMKVIEEASRGDPGSTRDRNVSVVLVGTNDMLKLFADMMKLRQYGATPTPIFKSMDEALSHIRADRARREQS